MKNKKVRLALSVIFICILSGLNVYAEDFNSENSNGASSETGNVVEYEFQDLLNICSNVIATADAIKERADNELDGTSSGFYEEGDEQEAWYNGFYDACTEITALSLEVERDTRIRFAAQVGAYYVIYSEKDWQQHEIQRNGSIRIALCEDASLYDSDNSVWIRAFDDNFSKVKMGDLIEVEGTFLKRGATTTMDTVYDCELISINGEAIE